MLATPKNLERRSEFYHQIGTMTEAGLSLVQALQSLNRSRSLRGFGQPVVRLLDRLEGGDTFAEAAAKERGWLAPFDLALFQAGERSGRLDVCFKTLAEFYRQRAAATREVIRQLIYPALVVHVAILLAPFPDLFLKGDLGLYLSRVGIFLIPFYVIVGAFVYLAQGSHGKRVRGLLETVFGWIPLLGAARRSLALSRFCLALQALLNSGTDMGRAWTLSAEASGSTKLQGAVAPFEEAIAGGHSPGELLNEVRVFPDLFVGLYQSGESSGRLDENIQRLQTHYQEEGTRKLQLFASWLPRLIYLGIVFVIGYRIVSFWSGFYQGVVDEVDF